MEEMAARGVLDHDALYIVRGDAQGSHRTSKSFRSDYDIIKDFLRRYRNKLNCPVEFRIDVQKKNPPIRLRHNLVNAYCRALSGRRRLFVYSKAKTLDEGLRLGALKKSAQYLEDDSKAYQHITTAAGYHVVKQHLKDTSGARQYNLRVR